MSAALEQGSSADAILFFAFFAASVAFLAIFCLRKRKAFEREGRKVKAAKIAKKGKHPFENNLLRRQEPASGAEARSHSWRLAARVGLVPFPTPSESYFFSSC